MSANTRRPDGDVKLSRHFSLAEFMTSEVAARKGWPWPEVPTHVESNMRRLCMTLGEPLRILIGDKPIVVTSGWRYPKLNAAIGGSRNSAHVWGRAMDIFVPGVDLIDVARAAIQIEACDKAILEFGSWLHLQTPAIGETPRQQALCAYKGTRLGMTKTCYATGFEPPGGQWM